MCFKKKFLQRHKSCPDCGSYPLIRAGLRDPAHHNRLNNAEEEHGPNERNSAGTVQQSIVEFIEGLDPDDLLQDPDDNFEDTTRQRGRHNFDANVNSEAAQGGQHSASTSNIDVSQHQYCCKGRWRKFCWWC